MRENIISLLIWLNVMVTAVENACSDGYYYSTNFNRCYQCKNNCITCKSKHICNTCKEGFHGSRCHKACNKAKGTCAHGCSSGYYQSGSGCLRCSIHNCVECTDENHCTGCAIGYKLLSSVSCSICQTGTWGYQCQNPCSQYCLNSNCNATNGDCYSCPKNSYGKQCQHWCFEGCKKHTSSSVCNRETGQCIYGCDKGFVGPYCDSERKPVDGHWGQWSKFTFCSATCGFGTTSRSRTCNDPSPQYGGRDCSGDAVESTSCNLSNCPVDGHWGDWSEFVRCSVTCGQGSWTRTRACDQPSPQHGGQWCSGRNTEKMDCNTVSCPVDGGWGQWSEFTPCSVTCGTGNKTRTRSCDQPEPLNNGHECVGEKSDITTCGDFNCTNSNQQTGASGAVVGWVAGGVALLVIVGLALTFIFIFRRQKQRRNSKECNQVVFVNNSTDTATAHGFENNSYNAVLNQDGSRSGNDDENVAEDYVYAQPTKPRKHKAKYSVLTHNEEKIYSVPLKDKTKIRLGVTEKGVKGKCPQEVLHTSLVPRKLPHYMDDSDLEEISESNTSEMDTTDGKIPEQSDMYYNTDGLFRHRIHVEKLANTVAEKSNDEFLCEFERLTDGLSRDYTAALKPENKYRNRYKQIFPYDVSRVKLNGESSDYINASHIDGYQRLQNYIACLGPTKTTTNNFALFWTMVWQQKVEKIVMLTRLLEGEKMKCEKYWPEADSETYGDITVYRISEVNYVEISIRNLDVVKGSERRRVCQIHYLAWPDRGVPDDVTSLLEFRHKVVGIPIVLNGPTIVHCSAGIGRTGTYIALDMLIREGSEGHYVDVFSCVNGIRGQRINLVQNVEQYKFLHYALVHELTMSSHMLSPEHMAWTVTEEGRNELRRQFKQLQAVIQKTPNTEAESVRRNRGFKTKNRKEADVPGDRHRVKLNSTSLLVVITSMQHSSMVILKKGNSLLLKHHCRKLLWIL